jgi:hypothetical protein
VIDFPRPSLWQVWSDRQLYLTEPRTERVTAGPAVTFTANVPDTDHYRGRGGRVYPSPPDVIILAVRWYLRFALSYRDVEELLAERGADVDHVRCTAGSSGSRRCGRRRLPCRHAVGDRWQIDETYVKVAGQWRHLYRAIDRSDRSSTRSSLRVGTRRLPGGASSEPSARPTARRAKSTSPRHDPLPLCPGL